MLHLLGIRPSATEDQVAVRVDHVAAVRHLAVVGQHLVVQAVHQHGQVGHGGVLLGVGQLLVLALRVGVVLELRLVRRVQLLAVDHEQVHLGAVVLLQQGVPARQLHA